ncbi:hypothetical protein [Streptomyces luteireticuli]|uniref:hypothetical protein n=1 Tax=Streptomyces luteireticuli TaxID=173858 RepID=UPI003558F8D1
MDGRNARGSRHGGTPAAHLLAAVTGTGQAVTQLRVPDRGNEIACFTALLDPLYTGLVMTADALHIQRNHATFLVESKQAHYLLTVEGNRPRLHAALRVLPWTQCAAVRHDREAGHDRRETRSVRALTVTGPGPDLPHVVQAAKILRHRTDTKNGKTTRQTLYAIPDT